MPTCLKHFAAIASLVLVGQLFSAAAAQEFVPRYLELAREVLQNVKPENNFYTYERRYVNLPGDFLSSGYTVHTDCTGFVEAMLDKGNRIRPRFSTQKLRDRYSIIDYVDGIDRGEMFTPIKNVGDMKPGDLVAWKYLKGSVGVVNGHIVMVDVAPVKVEPRAPIAKGFQQWEIWIIDSSPNPASPDDTRYVKGTSAAQAESALGTANAPKLKLTGVGRGRIYLYSDTDGAIKAMAYAFPKAQVFLQDDERRFVMARPKV